MSAEVESMFYVRKAPWHGLGTRVEGALNSREALIAAGLNWNVVQRKIFTQEGFPVEGYYANLRDKDQKVLGVVTSRYQIVQNREAFAFTDELLGKGVQYETAGSLKDGRKTWILARLPKTYRLAEDKVMPYLVFSNSHDGSGAIKVAMTPIRVVCNNTLNLALQRRKNILSYFCLSPRMPAKLQREISRSFGMICGCGIFMHQIYGRSGRMAIALLMRCQTLRLMPSPCVKPNPIRRICF